MSTDLGKKNLVEFFTTYCGVTPEPIQRSGEKSADFTADENPIGYLIELKARANRAEFVSDLAKGPTFVEEDPHFSQAFMNDAKKAVKQFQASDPQRDRLWILWIDTSGRTETDWGFWQAIDTLFGVRVYVDECINDYKCLHARESLLEKYQGIDAVVVRDDFHGMILCPNQFGKRPLQLGPSRLFQCFDARQKVVTTSSLCKLGYPPIDPALVDRNQNDPEHERSIPNFLLQRYGIKNAKPRTFTMHTGTIALPPRTQSGV